MATARKWPTLGSFSKLRKNIKYIDVNSEIKQRLVKDHYIIIKNILKQRIDRWRGLSRR